jgi:hypothetical protein
MNEKTQDKQNLENTKTTDPQEKDSSQKDVNKGQKFIPYSPISETLKAQLSKIIKDLKTIKEIILQNQNTILGKSDSIKNLLEKLQTSQEVKINEKAIDSFEKTQGNYSALAQFYSQELDHYSTFYGKYLELNQSEKIAIQKSDPSKTFVEYIETSIKRLKIFTKKRKKDVVILFSRYNHGFDLQLYKLNLVETHLQINEKKQQQIQE